MSTILRDDKQVREILKPYRKLVRGGDDFHHKNDNLRPAHYHIDIPEQVLITLIADRERAARVGELRLLSRTCINEGIDINRYYRRRFEELGEPLTLSAPQVKEE